MAASRQSEAEGTASGRRRVALAGATAGILNQPAAAGKVSPDIQVGARKNFV
jgi:hypothetical protein